MGSLFTDFLRELGVRHTQAYSDRRFSEMPFQSMFGLANLLGEYGVKCAGVRVLPGNRAQVLGLLKVPFLADTPDGFLIVTRVGDGTADYWTQGRKFTIEADKLIEAWNGVALLAEADSESVEPSYMEHHLDEVAEVVKKWGVIILAAALLGVAMWSNGLYANVWAWLVVGFDCAGSALSWLLIGKSLGVKSAAAEVVCSALDRGGCDRIARSAASSFFGLFKWSEVGVAYFSVSLLAMLLFPKAMAALAAFNLLCLPYSFWSIWYQKFKARSWCTMCVGVQASLWLLFFSYLGGGWERHIFACDWGFWMPFMVIVASFVVVLLTVNRIDSAILKHFKPVNDEDA